VNLEFSFEAVNFGRGPVVDGIGLVMPTSLCSGQISRRIANRLNESGAAGDKLTRFVALPHTEGCGVSGGSAESIYSRTLLGHLANPTVRFGLLLEHGCEKTHNDYFHARLREAGLDPSSFGWASVQLDGGIDRVVTKVEDWFVETLDAAEELEHETAGLEALRLGLYSSGPVSDGAARSFAEITSAVAASGGTVVVPERASLLSSQDYLNSVLGDFAVEATLDYGEAPRYAGAHGSLDRNGHGSRCDGCRGDARACGRATAASTPYDPTAPDKLGPGHTPNPPRRPRYSARRRSFKLDRRTASNCVGGSLT
jgi:hypothetical protein